MGWVIELRKPYNRVPTLGCGGKATSAAAKIASESRTRRSQRTQHVEKQHAREPGDFSGVPLYRGPVREGVSRTPDMHAVEGSDRAVVPMKLPNKEVLAASAEVVEGRARTKENVAELYTSPTTERGSPCPRGYAALRRSEIRFDAIIQGRAVCGNAARTDLCGWGGSAMAVPYRGLGCPRYPTVPQIGGIVGHPEIGHAGLAGCRVRGFRFARSGNAGAVAGFQTGSSPFPLTDPVQ